MTLQITRSRTACPLNLEEIQRMRQTFDQSHYLKFPQFLEPEILQIVQSRIRQAKFRENSYEITTGLNASDQRLMDEATDGLLSFLVNDLELFRLIEEITGCPKIGRFTGRVYRMSPNLGHYDSWHDDTFNNRLVAMSINLSSEVYSGGRLQMKDVRSGKMVQEISYTGFGEGVIFRIAPYLQHRVTEVKGSSDRTVFAGWFRSKPVYRPVFTPPLSRKDSDLFQRKAKVRTESSISKESTVVRADDLFYRRANGRLLVFNSKNTMCYGLDSVGRMVFNLLDKPIAVQKILEILVQEFEIKPGQCEKDLIGFLKELEFHGVIQS